MANTALLYEDDFLIAFNKPSGLLVHPSEIDPNEKDSALQQLQDSLNVPLFPVHRLDKPTSGILLMAKSSSIANQLMRAFSNREVSKEYWTLVRGHVPASDTIDYPLAPLKDKLARKQSSGKEQPAVTKYRLIWKTELPYPVGRYNTARYSLVQASPQTGRQRQIRRHFKHIFHPIVGDTAHGDGKHNQLFRDRFNCFRLMLHACEIGLVHPHSKEWLQIKAPPPSDFINPLKLIGAPIPFM